MVSMYDMRFRLPLITYIQCQRCRKLLELFTFLQLLWAPCVADADIIFLPCGFFYLFYLLFHFLA